MVGVTAGAGPPEVDPDLAATASARVEGVPAVALYSLVAVAGLAHAVLASGSERHDEVDDRPDTSSFPSGHTTAAVAFTAGAAPAWPAGGVACAVPAAAVAVERIQSGAPYPSDIAAGAVISLLSAWLTRRAPALLRCGL
ncbi:phosphatase PAP2 family protein [Streptomyces sp. NPDC014006]|uniref:phosphatase PAP2 family protein n=1 Tax=Streptomyces sp. NPDC014006 TaxID=3364870 RepID=UPI0036F603D5